LGLTEAKIKDLIEKKFDKLYTKSEPTWTKMAEDAYKFAKAHIAGGKEPRPDDILKALVPMLEVNQQLRDHQEDNKCRYKRFREYFGEYIIDKNPFPKILTGGGA
jgi:hypothetical protein